MVYIFIFLLLVLLSFRYDICGRKKYHEIWYNVVLVILILVAGLRWRIGTDTIGYIESFYTRIPLLRDIEYEGYMLKYPLWTLLNSLVLTIGGKFFVIQLVESTLLNVFLFKYIKKHSNYFFTCTLLYYIWLYTSFNMEEMKACMALPLCLYANDYFLDRKWLKGYLLLIVGCLFHFSVIVLLFIPLLYFLRLNLVGIFILVCTFFIGYQLQKILGDYLILFEFNEEIYDKAEGYADSEKAEGMSLLKTIFLILPIIIYTILSGYYIKKKEKDFGLNNLEPCMMLALVFLIFEINISIFYRYFHFYAMYCILFITQASVDFIHSSKKLTLSVSYARTIVLMIPFFFSILWPYKGKYYRYYPYYSVLERKIDKKREAKQSEFHPERSAVIYDWY